LLKPLHSYFPHTCWVRHVLTLAIKMLLRKRKLIWSLLKMLLSSRHTQPPVDYLWCFGAFISRIKRNTLIIFLFLIWYCLCIHLYVTICMKLDPSMHIRLHLVFFGKTGVTHVACRISGYMGMCSIVSSSWLQRWQVGEAGSLQVMLDSSVSCPMALVKRELDKQLNLCFSGAHVCQISLALCMADEPCWRAWWAKHIEYCMSIVHLQTKVSYTRSCTYAL
jgi:hypothetical protein